MTAQPTMRAKIHQRPDCGHSLLVECPLTVDDWAAVFAAWMGFRATCRIISEHAHERAAAKAERKAKR